MQNKGWGQAVVGKEKEANLEKKKNFSFEKPR